MKRRKNCNRYILAAITLHVAFYLYLPFLVRMFTIETFIFAVIISATIFYFDATTFVSIDTNKINTT